ncbi:MAG: hypothetical protein HY537_00095 [Deltaproteobacteria bacterium]|nr:hypothetical protein [Deltaproteobacteria bacterium]
MTKHFSGAIILFCVAMMAAGCSHTPRMNLSLTQPAKKVWVHGHRGSRGTHPENTLAAFKEAYTAGVDVLEMDLQLTADDVVVVSHEAYITPELCRGPKGKPVSKPIPIRQLSAQEVSLYDCGSLGNPKFPEQKRLASSIPTLESIIIWIKNEAPRLWLNIETKFNAKDTNLFPPVETFTAKIIELLRNYNIVDQTILQSFDFRSLVFAKKLEPRLRLSCLFERPFDFCEQTRTLGAHFASPHHSLLTATAVEKCHQAGIEVVPWTVNIPHDWQTLLEMGVDGIITDYPRKLVDYLANRQPKPN